MQIRLNERFISVIRRYAPEGEQLVNILTEILSISKETVYRRLRSEVPFTFEEVVKVSLKLGIPLESILEESQQVNKFKWAVLAIDKLLTPGKFFEQRHQQLETVLHLFKEMNKSSKSIMRYASNVIPALFLMPYEGLSKFCFYKWSYLTEGIQPDYLFSKLAKPHKVSEIEKQVIEEHKQMRTLFILDKNIFLFMVNDINYFYERKLITEQEYNQLKKELLDLIAYMENLASAGCYNTGSEITFYLSDISLDSSYVHFDYDDQSFCVFKYYFIDLLRVDNKHLSVIHRNWIESLKRYSIQISQSSEAQRFDFFNKQRQLIEETL